MTADSITAIPVYLPPAEALAVASVLKRMDAATVHAFASPLAAYDGRPEGDLAYAGMTRVLGALASAGFVAR